MKRIMFILLFTISGIVNSYCQIENNERKFSPAELKNDLFYLKQQLYTVHAFPYTELNPAQYNRLFAGIEARLTDSLTATSFLKMIKPVIAHLSDEHAQVYLPDTQLWKDYQSGPVFLPIVLTKYGKTYRVEKVLSPQSGLKTGETIKQIDNILIDTLIGPCALFTSGYPDQRLQKALRQFGYLYTWTLPGIHHDYNITTGSGKTVRVPGVSLKTWENELNSQTGWNQPCDEKIAYKKFNDAGYINACSFNIPEKQLDSIGAKIELLFKKIESDKIKYLFIDLSKNSGGQSRVGNMLIDYINNKPYRGYSVNFRKSQAYLNLLRSWKIEPEQYYKDAVEGTIIHFNSDTITPKTTLHRFKGRVIIIVGNGTFSSAMMMATFIKDNHLAIIAGETPLDGHPNGFGELYNTLLPYTKIHLLFGVKQWIRPSGDLTDNILKPDIKVNLSDNKEELIRNILNKIN